MKTTNEMRRWARSAVSGLLLGLTLLGPVVAFGQAASPDPTLTQQIENQKKIEAARAEKARIDAEHARLEKEAQDAIARAEQVAAQAAASRAAQEAKDAKDGQDPAFQAWRLARDLKEYRASVAATLEAERQKQANVEQAKQSMGLK